MFWISLTCVILLLVMMLAREIAVFRLRSRRREDWRRLGSPEFMERDILLRKFPYLGWRRVYMSSDAFDRAVLVAFFGVRGGGRIPTLGGVSAIRPNLGDRGAPSQSSDPEVPCDQTSGAPMTAGNPVVFSTGNKVEFETDFAADVEMGLSLTRTYNHYWIGTGIFGRHWLSNFDYSLASAEPGPNAANIWLQRPDGRSIKFQRTASGRWEEAKAQAIAYVTLSGNVYTHNSEDGLVEQYNANGYITRLASRQGVAWTFSYSNNICSG